MDYSKDLTFDQLTSSDFLPDKYVKDLSHNYVGGLELKNLCRKIQGFSEDTSGSLKRNVYQNYVQFIDASKEISHLESEMYQLSHLLTEQKSLLSALAATSVLETKAHFNIERDNRLDKAEIEEENRQKLAGIFESVEGCKVVVETLNRTFLFEGDLLEIDPTDNIALKFVHMYLFNDSIMITTRNTVGDSVTKFVSESFYELAGLAVVNVRDLGNIKHAFKLLIFPDTRVFQCSSNANKKEWIDKIDQAKKARLQQEQQKKESTLEKSPTRSVSVESPIQHCEEKILINYSEWFLNVPDDVEVCIAQRHFEEAVTYLIKAKSYIQCVQHTDLVMLDIQMKVDLRQNQLIDVLIRELEVNPGKSLQGGLRAARRSVKLLNQLDKSVQACDLFLKLCSSILKIQCKRVKQESSTVMYVRQLSSVVFTNMCHMSEEFTRAFYNNDSCISAYVVWAGQEISIFINHFIKQVFMPQTSLQMITECVTLVSDQCDRLCTYGMDFRYQLDGALRSPLSKALRETRDKLIDSIKLRVLEDKWIPINLVSKNALHRYMHEFENMGLQLDSYVTGDVWLQLTASNLAFTKTFLALLEDCLKVTTPELLYSIDETLYRVYEAQVRHNEQSIRNELNTEQRKFIFKNVNFLLGTLLDLSQSRYRKELGFDCDQLRQLKSEFSALLKGVVPAVSTVNTTYSSEFL